MLMLKKYTGLIVNLVLMFLYLLRDRRWFMFYLIILLLILLNIHKNDGKDIVNNNIIKNDGK